MMKKTDLQYVGKYIEDGHVHYQLKHLKRDKCPYCGSDDFFTSGAQHRTIIGYDKNENRIFFEVENPRMRCRECKRTWHEPLTRRGIKWADSIAKSVTEDFVEEGLSYSELKDKHEMSVNAIIQLVDDYMEEAEGKQNYKFSETVGLERIDIDGEPFYMLTDVTGFSVLDIMGKEDMVKNVRDESVRNVVLTDKRLIPLANAVFPKAGVFFHNLNLLEKGRNVLAEEGEKLGFNKREVLNALDPEKQKNGKKKPSIELLPIQVAYRFLEDNADCPEKLRSYNGKIPGFLEFCKELEDDRFPDGFSRMLIEEYDAGIMNIRSESSFYSDKPFRSENIKKLLLFNEVSHYPANDVENPNSFGREMVRRTVTGKQEKR